MAYPIKYMWKIISYLIMMAKVFAYWRINSHNHSFLSSDEKIEFMIISVNWLPKRIERIHALQLANPEPSIWAAQEQSKKKSLDD